MIAEESRESHGTLQQRRGTGRFIFRINHKEMFRGWCKDRHSAGEYHGTPLVHAAGDEPMPVVGYVDQEAAQIHFRHLGGDFVFGEGAQ